MSIRCLFGHKYKAIGKGFYRRVVDDKPVGTYIVSECQICGKIKTTET